MRNRKLLISWNLVKVTLWFNIIYLDVVTYWNSSIYKQKSKTNKYYFNLVIFLTYKYIPEIIRLVFIISTAFILVTFSEQFKLATADLTSYIKSMTYNSFSAKPLITYEWYLSKHRNKSYVKPTSNVWSKIYHHVCVKCRL